ncbi:NAD(P)/FAD-dependent oxidoreductase [Lentzea aerocolonigenes]|uniref:NAD(P)/FAD-dependent oxidoreductase n=1 Tax=Lentzea aerocolonigenes TaxID=68170 RepID=UPI0004C323B6|nr:FAD-dependent oxidoreductase [Lentzea aerocolonigenes]MCP2246450.1 NADPH-dependent 2,4-dienoyl-CoA reductase, sulfur reductase [Lentzea aerocolonigenes]
MAEPQRIVIAGTGLAGASAAGALRERGYGGKITMFGTEHHRPYELPALSKDLLLGKASEPTWVHEPSFYADNEIDLQLGVSVLEVRPGDHAIVDSDGAVRSYDRLLLATGSRPRVLPGAQGHVLRTLDDSLALKSALREGRHVVIIGAGWIGCEVASAARTHGCRVTVVDPLSEPLVRVLGTEMGAMFRGLHTEHGVEFKLGTGVQGFTPSGPRLDDGTELIPDVTVLAVGATPRLELAEAAGLDLADGGVAVDATLRTSAPDVFAAGDIAAHDHPRYDGRVRVEHWANAKDQGTYVAGPLLGEDEPYEKSPYFFTDQYDLGMEYRGLAGPDDEVVVRGDLAARQFIAFWLRDGRVRAAMNVNVWDDGAALKALVDAQATTTPDQLREAELSSLV